MRLITLMFLAFALTGCDDATTGPRQAQEQLRQAKALEERYDGELSDPLLAILADKVDLHEAYRSGQSPCAALGRDRLPSEEESVALKRWAALHASFAARLESTVISVPAGSSYLKGQVDQFYAIMDNGLRSQDVLIANLADGRMSYCQFAAEDKTLTEGVLREAGAVRTEVRRELAYDASLVHNYVYPVSPLPLAR